MDKNFSLSEKRQRYELFINGYNLLDKKMLKFCHKLWHLFMAF